MPNERTNLYGLLALGPVLLLGVIIFLLARLLLQPVESNPNALPVLKSAQTIHIEEDWSGYNDIAPVLAHYDLANQNGRFEGKGFFSMGGALSASQQPVSTTAPITVPMGAMQSLLNTLQSVRAHEGPYPTPSCCDDYPSLKIELQLPTEKITLFSTSNSGDYVRTRPPDNGEPWMGLYGHVPWGLTFRGKTYIIDSPLPAQALAVIDGYLQKDVWDKLAAEFNSR